NRLKDLRDKLNALTEACNARPYGRPEDIKAATGALIAWCDTLAADVDKAPYDNDSVRDLMRHLCRLYAPDEEKADAKKAPVIPDYEQAREVASILEVLHEEYNLNGGKDDKAADALKQLRKDLNLTPYKVKDRAAIMLEVVKQTANQPNIDTKE